jgi:hypothetical protein
MATTRKATVTRMAARMWWTPLVPIGCLADRGSRWRWLLLPGVVIFTALTSSVGKLVIRRPRPGSVYRVVPWGRLGAAGFPSTHSACAFAVAGWLRSSRHGRWLHVLALFIGCSRVRCGAHHSTDVAAGAILGYGIAQQIDKTWSHLRTSRIAGPADPAMGQVADPPEKSSAIAAPRESRSTKPPVARSPTTCARRSRGSSQSRSPGLLRESV